MILVDIFISLTLDNNYDEINLNCELKARCEEEMPIPTSPFNRLNILVSRRMMIDEDNFEDNTDGNIDL